MKSATRNRLKSDRRIAESVMVTALMLAGAAIGTGSHIFAALCFVAALLSFEEIRNLTNVINHNRNHKSKSL